MHPYLQVFVESAWAASVIPLASETTYFAMKLFGNYNMAPAFVLAVAGATLGHLFNWGCGKVLLKYPMFDPPSQERPRYLTWQARFHKYGIFVLLLSWAPVLNFVVVAAGFFNVRLKLLLPLVILGNAAYYGYVLL